MVQETLDTGTAQELPPTPKQPASSAFPLRLATDQRQRMFEEYQTLVGMFQYEGQLRWTIFGVFLLTETVLFALLGENAVQLTSTSAGRWLLTAGAGAGIVLCVAWHLTFRHYSGFYTLRIQQAKSLEEALGFRAFHEGAEFGEGKIPDHLVNFPQEHTLSGLDRLFGGRTTALVLVWVFGVLFAGLLMIAWWQVVRGVV